MIQGGRRIVVGKIQRRPYLTKFIKAYKELRHQARYLESSQNAQDGLDISPSRCARQQ